MVNVLDSQSRGPMFKTTGMKSVPGISGNLVVKNKLPLQSVSSLEAVEPHP